MCDDKRSDPEIESRKMISASAIQARRRTSMRWTSSIGVICASLDTCSEKYDEAKKATEHLHRVLNPRGWYQVRVKLGGKP